MKELEEGIEEMGLDECDPGGESTKINFDIIRTRGWGRCFHRLGRYKTSESRAGLLFGQY